MRELGARGLQGVATYRIAPKEELTDADKAQRLVRTRRRRGRRRAAAGLARESGRPIRPSTWDEPVLRHRCGATTATAGATSISPAQSATRPSSRSRRRFSACPGTRCCGRRSAKAKSRRPWQRLHEGAGEACVDEAQAGTRPRDEVTRRGRARVRAYRASRSRIDRRSDRTPAGIDRRRARERWWRSRRDCRRRGTSCRRRCARAPPSADRLTSGTASAAALRHAASRAGRRPAARSGLLLREASTSSGSVASREVARRGARDAELDAVREDGLPAGHWP